MMTRNYYSYENPEVERYRQRQYPMEQWDQRNTALELSYSDRQHSRSGPIHRTERMPLDNEQDTQNVNSQTRRQRIAVAVSMIVRSSGRVDDGFSSSHRRNTTFKDLSANTLRIVLEMS
jgi:hypothetical protein